MISSMASNQKKAPKQIPRRNRFLACFGITSKSNSKSEKKRNKTGGGGSESWFKLCMPKIKIIIIRRKGKGSSFDAKTVALEACQSIIKFEATKIRQAKINHGLITQEVTKNTIPVQSEEPAISREQTPIATVKKCDDGNKVTKDSLVGVSMMVITLIIMTFWGYLCAIICMSAWLYCVPLLKMCKDVRRPNVMGSLKASQHGFKTVQEESGD